LSEQIQADKDYTLVKQIMQAAYIFEKVRARELLPLNLSVTAADILFLVKALGTHVTGAKIYSTLMIQQHALYVILKSMEKRGLLKRTPDKAQKTQILITLTARGENTLRQVMKLEGTTHVLSRLSSGQKSRLHTMLSEIKDAGMEEIYLPPNVLLWP
jgi:DNA-binding MarR family transcriptional regulator